MNWHFIEGVLVPEELEPSGTPRELKPFVPCTQGIKLVKDSRDEKIYILSIS